MADGFPDFDPSRYLTRVNGADYLEVKWRLLWLRSKHPDADIDTELVTHQELPNGTWLAIFKACVRIPGGGIASGYGSETSNDFRDFLEKAETKAIGRALAALGFGTQFSFDHIHGGVVDAPVTQPRSGNPPEPPALIPATDPQAHQRATTRQQTFLQAMATRAGYVDQQQLNGLTLDRYDTTHDLLTQHQATMLAYELRQRPPVRQNGVPATT
jgi:hypothetical protein